MDLETCPHCGGEATLRANYSGKYCAYMIFVKCDICGAQGKTVKSYDDPRAKAWDNVECWTAINAWNMRKGPDYDI